PHQAGKGNAEIIVKVPSAIKKVKDGVLSSITAAPETESIVSSPEWTYDSATELYSKTYEYSSLDAGKTHYAIFKMYDSSGNVIAGRFESLIIIAGQTSKATIIVDDDKLHTYDVQLELKKDGELWKYNDKEIVLVDVNDSSNTYVLKDTFDNGKFDGKEIPRGDYKVIIRDEGTGANQTDTGLTFNPSTGKYLDENGNEVSSLNFKSVDVAGNGVKLTPTTPMPAALPSEKDGEILVREGSTTPIEFTVDVDGAYEADSSGDGIKINGTTVINSDNTPNTEADTNDSKQGVQQNITPSDLISGITISGTSPKVFTITFITKANEVWTTGYPQTISYTIESNPLPLLPNTYISNSGYTFNGWKNSGTEGPTAGKTFSAIPEGTWGNLVLEALWKDGVVIPPEAPSEEEQNAGVVGSILTSGYSLIVKWDDSKTKTLVYIDKGNLGEFDSTDEKVTYVKDNVTKDDFTNFKLEAKNADGSAPTNDFTFTILGGQLACVEGPGKDANCVSTVNIKGADIKIGNNTSNGVILDSLTNQKIFITGDLTGNYSITLISENKFKPGAATNEVALITASTTAGLQVSKFTCLYAADKSPLELGVDSSGTKLSLINTEPILLPDSDGVTPGVNVPGGVIWVEEDDGSLSKTDFTLGDTAIISIPCSVFSVSVKNGSMVLGQTVMKDESGNALDTDNLGEYSDTSLAYSTSLDTTGDYTYIHMFSKTNQITPERATEFLKSITFKKIDKDTKIQLNVNLETVPYTTIQNFADKEKFKYYDGSFYLYVEEKTSWTNAYNAAKSKIFNGLNGYLITITSETENNYINSELKASRAWTGGSRHDLSSYGGWDSNYLNNTGAKNSYGYTYFTDKTKSGGKVVYFYTEDSVFRWTCGPEAGKVYYNKTKSGGTETGTVDINYSAWEDGEPNNSSNKSYAFKYNIIGDIYEEKSYEESCMQFKNGNSWNDCPDRDYGVNTNADPQSYIVEFRPYVNDFNVQKANYQSVKLDAAY
ncbi:MAG: hypothetical protein HUK25_04825, partial [Treponema sp.]|nr:hypothetical protein [Treponema sp.]